MTAARRFAALGVGLVLLGLATGFVSGVLANPRMGLSAHLEGIMNGTLLLALGAVWHQVRLPVRQERWAFGLIAFAAVANWLATLLGALWGAGHALMPIATGLHRAAAWQEAVVSWLLITLSLAVVAGLALVLKGLLVRSPEA